jgi:hypothetical protein
LQAANIMVAIGGERGNTVPKYGVSATEISVLMAIHGPGAIFDVEPTDDIDVRPKDELARIRSVYTTDAGRAAIERLYPGVGAKPITDIDDLDLAKDDMKASGRVKAPPAPKTKEEKVNRKRQEAVDKATEAGVARPQNLDDVEDGIADMPDSGILG